VRTGYLAILVTACNQVYGIDSTALSPPDLDRDGVLDADDNCPTAYNTDQSDRDADTFGDACDGCPDLMTAANHDEDRDGYGDECDVCPGVPEFQDDQDRDGVGDACDFKTPFIYPMERLRFDPFLSVAEDWTRQQPWQGYGDAIGPSEPLPPGALGLGGQMLVLEQSFLVMLGIVSTRPWAPGDRFGIVFRQASNGEPFVECVVECAPDCWLIAGPVGAPSRLQPVAAVPETSLQATVGYSALVNGIITPVEDMMACGFGGEPRDLVDMPFPAVLWPEFVATPSIQLGYVDVLQ
jgi:hypothetical protein